MIQVKACFILSLALVCATGLASAQEGCGAICTCACQADVTKCTVLVCSAPAVASCQDGSCGAFGAKCCCSSPGHRGCAPYDRGDWPTYQCAKSAPDGSPTATAVLLTLFDSAKGGALRRVGSSDDDATPDLCRALRRMNPEDDLWSYVELAPPAKSGIRRYRIRFASDSDYGRGLQRCADLGLAFDEDQETTEKPEFLFRFRAPRTSTDLPGLHPALQVPDGVLGNLSGVAAIQLKMTSTGQILSKGLLFTTNTRLGEALLLGIDAWFSVVSGTEEPSTFEDVLFLKVEAGKLGMAIEHHHARRASTT